jgi:hypothetical protein
MNARLRTAALVNLAMVVEQANEQVRCGQQQQQEQGMPAASSAACIAIAVLAQDALVAAATHARLHVIWLMLSKCDDFKTCANAGLLMGWHVAATGLRAAIHAGAASRVPICGPLTQRITSAAGHAHTVQGNGAGVLRCTAGRL